MPQPSALLTLMIAAARKASRGLRRDFGEVENLQVSKKGPADFVTAADQKAEETLYQELSKARPGYGFLMEERGAVEGTDKSHRWVVDPLDGTLNFMHAIPHFAISIGLERDGQPVAGVIYNPISDDLFYGEKGKAAFHNDRRLRVSARQGLTNAVLATGIPYRGRPGHARFLTELHGLMPEVAGVRRFGSAALDLAWVAAGRFDAFWERELNPWDIAAGIVIVREAGGVTRDLEGGDPMTTGAIVAGPEAVVAPLLEQLRERGT
jgi:myo-inositol-1(or 4)-monophosphatase